MVILRLSMNVHPEKQLEFKQTLISMVEPIEKETGCLSCVVLCGLINENHFSLIGEWKTRQDLDNHIKSYRFGIILGSKSLLTELMRIQILTVETSDAIGAVHALRTE